MTQISTTKQSQLEISSNSFTNTNTTAGVEIVETPYIMSHMISAKQATSPPPYPQSNTFFMHNY